MDLFSVFLNFFTGGTPYNYEMRALGIALQGAMVVRNTKNKDGQMHPFHAFALTSIVAFGGGWFAFIWMGKPTSMIANGDVNIVLCLLAFLIVNYSPGDIGYKLASFLPIKILITACAQLFRSLGTVGFVSAAAAEVAPSVFYPTAVLGPILYGTLLGNMGGFFLKGFDGHLKDGMPWTMQNGKLAFQLFLSIFFRGVPFSTLAPAI